jgi:hypothetical protein
VSTNARRVVATALAALGLAVLTAGALRTALRVPLGTSLSVARRFWAGNTPTRVLNSPPYLRDRRFGEELLRADATLPLDGDVVLKMSAATPPDRAEERRRLAAFVLAPRRVTLRRQAPGVGNGTDTGLEPARP